MPSSGKVEPARKRMVRKAKAGGGAGGKEVLAVTSGRETSILIRGRAMGRKREYRALEEAGSMGIQIHHLHPLPLPLEGTPPPPACTVPLYTESRIPRHSLSRGSSPEVPRPR